MLSFYYLLYKLKNSEIIWIVKISNDLFELKKHIKHVSSDIEKYYIVVNDHSVQTDNLDIKQFTQFHPSNDWTILYETDCE